MKLYKLTEIAAKQWPNKSLLQLQSLIEIYKPLPEYRDAWIKKCVELQKIDFHDNDTQTVHRK